MMEDVILDEKERWKDEEFLEENAELLKALAHPNRLKIIGFLSSGKKCVKHIWEALDYHNQMYHNTCLF